MILGYLLKTSLAWREADIRLKMVIPNEDGAEDARRNLKNMLEQTRTGLQTEVLVSGERSAFDLLHDSSRAADLIIMGIAAPDQGDFTAYYEQLRERTSGLPCTVFALASEDVAFREVLFRPEDQR